MAAALPVVQGTSEHCVVFTLLYLKCAGGIFIAHFQAIPAGDKEQHN